MKKTTYKDVLRMIRAGKTPAQIMAAVPGKPYRLKRMLCGPRFAAELEMERQLSGRLGRHRLAVNLHHLIERRLQLVDDEDAETARKAAETLTQTYSGPAKKITAKQAQQELLNQQKVDFLKQLIGAGAVDVQVLFKNHQTGKYRFEEAIERKNNEMRR
jgi:hypothetical protein